MEWITILAIMTGPIAAVQISRWLDELRLRHGRRLQLFKTLMSTRFDDSRVSASHVQALNMIDIEFESNWPDRNRPSLKAVVDAWKEYLDQLNTPRATNEAGNLAWTNKSDDLFIELLHVMSVALGYDFDKVLLKKGIYSPTAHGMQSMYGRIAQSRVMEILEGKRAIPICVQDSIKKEQINPEPHK